MFAHCQHLTVTCVVSTKCLRGDQVKSDRGKKLKYTKLKHHLLFEMSAQFDFSLLGKDVELNEGK